MTLLNKLPAVALGLDTVVLRHRRHLALVACFVTLGLTLLAVHNAIGADHSGDAPATCVAVLQVLVLGVVAIAGVAPPRGATYARPRSETPIDPAPAPRPEPRARAGPPLLQIFRL